MRPENEITHGYKLVQSDPEKVWGWGTPAGQIRAKRRAEMIISGADLKPGLHALEIGCGTGLFTEMFANTGAHLVAVDISGELLKFAHARGLTSDRVQFLEKRFEECNIDGPFDAVIGSSILHHLEIKDAIFKIYSLLKPGGVMCFTEPNMLNPQIFIQKNVPWIKEHLGDSADETAFLRWPFRSLLLNAGFEKEEIKPFDWLHPATPVMLIKSISVMSRFLEKIPVVREFAGSLYIKCQRPKRKTYNFYETV